MTELFLLGAGASVEAGIPDTYGMTKLMLDKFSNDYFYQDMSRILQFVVGGLFFQQGMKGENPYYGINIENLFNSVNLLAERQASELAPFISSWHPHLVGLESGHLESYTARDLLEIINGPIEDYIKEIVKTLGQSRKISYGRNKIDTFHSSSRFRTRFIEAIRQVMIGGEGELFKATASTMIINLIKMVWINEPSKVTYLNPLVEYAKKNKSILATLNYDNSIELVGKNLCIEINTGFDSWSTNGEFAFEPEIIPLLKLHGSIDWELSAGQISKEKPLPFQVITKVDPDLDKKQEYYPTLVFGGKNKLTAKGPFLSLLRSFDQQLSKSETLWVIGYSFRDEHVNEFIYNWFNNDPMHKINIINPNPDSINPVFTNYLHNDLAEERIQIISETTGEFVTKLN